jgi:O-antigen ligase
MATWIFFYLMPAGLYWIARQTRASQRSFNMMCACLGTFGVYLAVTAFAETRQWWWAVYPSYIKTATFTEFFGRGRGPLLNPAGCGILQSTCLCAALLLWPQANRFGRLLLAGTTLAISVGIYCTLTRSAWMGGALSLVLIVGATMPRHWRVPMIGAVSLAGVLLVATQWERLLSFKRDEKLSAAATAESAKLRPILAVVAWKVFCDKPLFGLGLGQYQRENVNYIHDRSIDLPLASVRPYVQHNVLLSLLTETGLLGMGLFVAMLLTWMRDARRLYRTGDDMARRQSLLFFATVAAWFPNAMFQDVSIIPMVNMLLWFMAGLTEGQASRVGFVLRSPLPRTVPQQVGSTTSVRIPAHPSEWTHVPSPL